MNLLDRITGQWWERAEALLPANPPEEPAGSELQKGVAAPGPSSHGTPSSSSSADMPGKAWRFDPQDMLVVNQGYVEPSAGPMSLTYETLKRMARVPPFAAVIQTRLNQVAEFARPQESPYEVGYKVLLRDRSGRRSATNAEAQAISSMETFFAHCGVFRDADDLIQRDHFECFLKKLCRDSFRYDQAAIEILPDRRGRVAGFQAVDGATIRRARERTESPTGGTVQASRHDARRGQKHPAFVQVIRSQVVASWYPGELCMGIRRPRTDLESHGYGYPEMEELVQIVTAWLFGFDYNMNYFRQGSATKGFMKVRGNIPERKFDEMKRTWLAMVTGHHNAWKTPWFNVPGDKDNIEFERLQLTNDEMQYAEWMNWLLKLSCAVFQMDPAEVGFKFGNEGRGQEMFESNQEARIRASKDKGLRPLLRSIEHWLNIHITWRMNPDLEFRFAGLDGVGEKDHIELDSKRVKSFATLNEVRRERGLPDLPWGDVILDPVAMQAQTMAEGGGASAAPGEDPASLERSLSGAQPVTQPLTPQGGALLTPSRRLLDLTI